MTRRQFENRIRASLEAITDTIGKLNSVSKLICDQSAEAVDRDRRKTRILEDISRTHNPFSDELSSIVPFQKEDVLPTVLKLLWKYFPRRPDLESMIGSRRNPGDGLLYDQKHVTDARSVLNDLLQAWHEAENLRHYPPPSGLQDMAIICLIITGMQKQFLLLDFLRSAFTDSDLRVDMPKLETILKDEHRRYARTFFLEQSRALPREWTEGSHKEFYEGEPMPMIYLLEDIGEGSFSHLMKVKDPFTEKMYVRKQQKIHEDMNTMQSYRSHLEQETRRLKDLNHRHVVRLVKSYERGKIWGLVMEPVANSDLRRLLDRYKRDEYYHLKDCKDSEWLRPVFCTAFGCLAQGLAYIHGRSLRHKDIKPENILYQPPQSDDDQHFVSDNTYGKFLWADFGLAYDFSSTGDSKTRSTKLYSARYAPPEVVAANAIVLSKTVSQHDTITKEGGDMIRADMIPQALDAEIKAHGRAADRFALGCVYLELLSCLVKEDLPLKEGHESKVMFSANIDGLCNWATEMKKAHPSAGLQSLFDIAIDMIQARPDKRPSINEIVHRVMIAGDQFACQPCRSEYC